ncbi:MAG: Arm DNA-binding domain-containing protein [Acidobacteria bacterium]|nr:Arm DNA-binding domain-containing protein [Acidobacteriota bacterium]
MERLTARRAETLRKPGRYQAGDTVYLVVARGRTGRVNKRWIQRLHVQGKRRDISIGTYPAVTLSEARERAHGNRLTAKRGGDPSGRVSTVPTFAEVSAKVDQGSQWRGPTRETRRRTLARYAGRLMGRPVDQIDRAAVLSVLGPAYRDKPAPRQVPARLGPRRARGGASSRTCRRERGG